MVKGWTVEGSSREGNFKLTAETMAGMWRKLNEMFESWGLGGPRMRLTFIRQGLRVGRCNGWNLDLWRADCETPAAMLAYLRMMGARV
jgi:hypothetical protein